MQQVRLNGNSFTRQPSPTILPKVHKTLLLCVLFPLLTSVRFPNQPFDVGHALKALIPDQEQLWHNQLNRLPSAVSRFILNRHSLVLQSSFGIVPVIDAFNASRTYLEHITSPPVRLIQGDVQQNV